MRKDRLPNIKCPICGKSFHPKNSAIKYCCRECAGLASRKLKSISCPTCGKSFRPKNYTTKFCCKECASKFLTLPDKICPVCGKEFHPVKADIIYCCNDCYLQDHKRKDRECKYCGKIFSPNHTGQKYCCRVCQWASLRKLPDIKCAECGKEFRPKNKYTVYCSKGCQYKAKSKGNKIRWEHLSEEERQKQIAPLFDYNNLNDISKINIAYKEYLEGLGFSVELEKQLGWGAYDLCIGNTLIDINPFAYHNVTWHPYDKPRDKNYHYEKLRLARESGYKCIMVRDWDTKEKIGDLLNDNKKRIGARECEIRQLEYRDTHKFFEDNHVQGDTAKNKNNVYIGLFYGGLLVEAMSFGKPRQNENYEWEILRLCTLRGYSVTGGASRIFKDFLELVKPRGVISYCDMSKFTGEIYTQLGFKLLKCNPPSKHWYNPKLKQHITDWLVRHCSADKLLKTNYGKGTDNNELMRQAGYVEIYDCGQATYVYGTKKVIKKS